MLTLPFGLRFRLAYDTELTSEILRLFNRGLFSSLRASGSDSATRSISTFTFRTLVLEGVYVRDDAILRWNSCVRTISRCNLKPRTEEMEPLLE